MNNTIRINVNTARIKKICPTRISRKISPSTLLQINNKTDILVIWICFPFLNNVKFKEMICWTGIVIAFTRANFTECYIILVKHLKHCSIAWLTWIICYMTIIIVIQFKQNVIQFRRAIELLWLSWYSWSSSV